VKNKNKIRYNRNEASNFRVELRYDLGRVAFPCRFCANPTSAHGEKWGLESQASSRERAVISPAASG